jgi:HPt (histidine-containing phosphotransfer) domain-containing protein
LNDSLDTSALQALRESIADDAEFLAELVGAFLEDSPAQLAELRAATTRGNADDVRREAHTLKSNGATFGIVRLTDLSRQLEHRASEGNLDGAEELVSAIGDALAEARPALEALTVVDPAS